MNLFNFECNKKDFLPSLLFFIIFYLFIFILKTSDVAFKNKYKERKKVEKYQFYIELCINK